MAEDVQRISGTTAKAAARLCNFVTAKWDLLRTHVDYLDKEVAPVIQSMQGPWVDLFGYASRAGDTNFNLALSQKRLDSVRNRVASYASVVNFQMQKALGELESGPNERDNSGYWRAVEIYVYAKKPERKKSELPPSSQKFEIRVVGGSSFSAVAQADNYIFQIVDLVRKQTAFYHYTGGGLGLSIPKIPGPGSMTYAGPPTPFKTTRPAELHQFNARAILEQEPGASLGNWSIDGALLLRLIDMHDALGQIMTVPLTVKVSGGAGIQMPGAGSVTEGVLAMVTPVWPFTGY